MSIYSYKMSRDKAISTFLHVYPAKIQVSLSFPRSRMELSPHMMMFLALSCSQNEQGKLWLDCAVAQNDLSQLETHITSRKHAYIIFTPLNPSFI